jgi:hypothetical protein
MSAAENKAVFLSYASQDAGAAKRICDALRAAGVEVWFDQSELVGGDAWDQKIRKQIKECALLIPVISANTQARTEGYFRLEWRLADQRTHLMAKGRPFLLPVVIDGTRDSEAQVPDSFLEVQWTRLLLRPAQDFHPGDQALPAFAERVRKLLAGDSEMEAGRPRPVQRDGDVASPRGKSPPSRTWLVPAILGAAAIVALAIWQPWRKNENPSAAAPVPPPAPSRSNGPALSPSNGLSEVRPLVAKARELFYGLDATREDFALAEDLLKQAQAKDGTDAETWAVLSQLNSRYVSRGFDVSNQRLEAASAAAQRAIRLDAQSFAARYAQVSLIRDGESALQESEKALRALHQERPDDQVVLHALSRVIQKRGRVDEANALYDESARLPGGDPLALYSKSLNLLFLGRAAEAEAAIQASLAQKSFTTALGLSMWYALTFHGDLDRAKAILDRMPPAALQEDRPCWFAYMLHLYRREPDAALEVLQAVPRDWFNDNWYRGPKGALAGDALRQAGRLEAARLEWRAALKLVDGKLADDGTNLWLLNNRVSLLAKLGEPEEAARQFSAMLQLSRIDLTGDKPAPGWVAALCVELGRNTEAMRQISLGLKVPENVLNYYTVPILRLDPLWEPLRHEPGFPALLAEAEAADRVAAQPAPPAADRKAP